MKKLLLITIIALMGFGKINAQETSGVIKVNPLGLLFGAINLNYEKPLNEKRSISIGASYFNWHDEEISGLGLTSEYRFYLSNSRQAPKGFNVAPGILLSQLTDKSGSTNESVFSYAGTLTAGYQWLLGPVAIDLYGGYGYRVANFKGNNKTGGFPILGLGIGYAF